MYENYQNEHHPRITSNFSSTVTEVNEVYLSLQFLDYFLNQYSALAILITSFLLLHRFTIIIIYSDLI